jgi:acetyl-CoA C-acetyltransferase
LRRSDVDFFVEVSYDSIDGRMISNMYTVSAAGAYLRAEHRVSDNFLLGLAYAYAKILSGEADTALVVAYSTREVRDGDFTVLSNLIFDPFYYRPLMNHIVGLGLQASSYRAMTNVSDEVVGRVVVKNRRMGSMNPLTGLKGSITLEEVLSSDYVVYPLRGSMLPPRNWGAVALVLAEETTARRLSDAPVWIAGIQWATDGYYLGGKPLGAYLQPAIPITGTLLSIRRASSRLFSKLNINNPEREIGLFEVCDVTPYHEIMAYEGLGLANWGTGYRLVEEGATDPRGGRIPVNPSGGHLSLDPYPATGAVKVLEAYLQLRGEAGSRQLSGVSRALVHDCTYINAPSTFTQSVAVLER